MVTGCVMLQYLFGLVCAVFNGYLLQLCLIVVMCFVYVCCLVHNNQYQVTKRNMWSCTTDQLAALDGGYYSGG